MYAVSFSLIAAENIIAKPFGIVLTSYVGTPLDGAINDYVCLVSSPKCPQTINGQIINVTSTSRTTVVTNPIGAAASFAWTLIQLITGTYVFNVLYLLGIPLDFIIGLTALYFFLLVRALIGYVRGI